MAKNKTAFFDVTRLHPEQTLAPSQCAEKRVDFRAFHFKNGFFHNQEKKAIAKGFDVYLCGRNARFVIDGRKLCKLHAGQAILKLVCK